MRVGPFFKCFGSKWQSAKRYPAPRFANIVEPFAGGAGYSCNYSHLGVTLYELHPQVRRLWGWLIQEATQAEITEIPHTLPVGLDIRTLGLSEGQSLLVKWWQRTNNFSPTWLTSPWCNSPGMWNLNTRSRIADELGAIKHWNVCEHFSGSTEKAPTIATWFIDPPYQFNHNYGSKFSAFKELGEVCKTLATNGNQVIVCEAMGKNGERPNWLPFVNSHESVTSRRKESQSHHSKELVWIA